MKVRITWGQWELKTQAFLVRHISFLVHTELFTLAWKFTFLSESISQVWKNIILFTSSIFWHTSYSEACLFAFVIYRCCKIVCYKLNCQLNCQFLNSLCADQWPLTIWFGVIWSCSSGEEEDDLDVVEPDHDNSPHKVPHLLATITPVWAAAGSGGCPRLPPLTQCHRQ
jgi:hypothetical protein